VSSLIGLMRGPTRILAPGVVALVVIAACEVPESPEWDVGVIAPFSSEPLAIVDWLPAAVDTTSFDGVPAFTVDDQRDSVAYTLGDMCSSCQALDGLTVPVPGFDFVDSLDVFLAQDLFSVEVLSARLGTLLTNGLDFDPLRPNPDPAAAGYIAVAVRDLGSGALLDSVLVSGADESLPPGGSRPFELQLNDVEISEGVRTVLYVHSPDDGQVATISTSDSLALTTFLSEIGVSAVTARLDDRTLEEAFTLDVDEEARQEIADRVQTASYELQLDHTLEVTGTLQVSIADSRADLFSGDPLREVRLPDLSLAPGLVQQNTLTVVEVQRIASFTQPLIGYFAVASGTRQTGAQANLARFTPGQQIDAQLTVTSRVRVGE